MKNIGTEQFRKQKLTHLQRQYVVSIIAHHHEVFPTKPMLYASQSSCSLLFPADPEILWSPPGLGSYPGLFLKTQERVGPAFPLVLIIQSLLSFIYCVTVFLLKTTLISHANRSMTNTLCFVKT